MDAKTVNWFAAKRVSVSCLLSKVEKGREENKQSLLIKSDLSF